MYRNSKTGEQGRGGGGGGGGVGVKLGVVGKSVVSFAMCCFSLDLCFKSHFWLLGQAALNYLFLLYSPDSQQCGGGYFSSLDKPRQTWG